MEDGKKYIWIFVIGILDSLRQNMVNDEIFWGRYRTWKIDLVEEKYLTAINILKCYCRIFFSTEIILDLPFFQSTEEMECKRKKMTL